MNTSRSGESTGLVDFIVVGTGAAREVRGAALAAPRK